jgi:hypothetical protein
MVYRFLADAVMLTHVTFLVFLALGGFVAWGFRWLIVPHVAAAGWGLVSVVAGIGCPLTGWEDRLRRRAGEAGLPGGFIDTYLTGVVYPNEHLMTARLLVAGLVAASWVGFAVRRTSAPPTSPP